MLVIVGLAVPFVASGFQTLEVAYALIFAIAILGLNVLTGFSGQISLGHGAFVAIGAFTTAITNGGGGGSWCRGTVVTRMRPDPTRDPVSAAIYLRDVRSGEVWSATHQPTRREADAYLVHFLPEKAVFRLRDDAIETQLEIAVSPEDDVEVRRLSISNRDDQWTADMAWDWHAWLSGQPPFRHHQEAGSDEPGRQPEPE